MRSVGNKRRLRRLQAKGKPVRVFQGYRIAWFNIWASYRPVGITPYHVLRATRLSVGFSTDGLWPMTATV